MPIRRLLRRLKNPRTNQFHSTNWGDFHSEIDAQFQLLGASVVGSWEILLTDAARSHRMAHGIEMPDLLYQRLSDAIVPLQQSIQKQTKTLQHSVKQFSQMEEKSTLNLQGMLTRFPSELSESWTKTCTYLRPAFSELDLEDLIRQWDSAGEALLASLQRHLTLLSPPTADLSVSKPALIKWREATVKSLELELYARRTELCEALKN